jgi:predicted nucleotidyltransferase
LNDELEKIADVLRAGPELRFAALFGSVARGNAHAQSDVDIAILPRNELTLAEELALQQRLEAVSGRRVDLVRIDRAPAVLRWQIASTGVLLHADPGSDEWTRFRVSEASAHAEIGEMLERCTKLFLRRLARSG